MSEIKSKRIWAFLIGIVLSALFFRFVHGRSEILAYAVPIAAMVSLVLMWPRLKADATPAKRSDVIGYVVIALALAGALWLVLTLVR
jgi:peptidoglycan biosynthesis protein MviN/MurJ (putative lipid II flippase)